MHSVKRVYAFSYISHYLSHFSILSYLNFL